MTAPAGTGVEPFVAARHVALYGLSLAASSFALLAWAEEDAAVAVPVAALALAAALVASEWIAPRLAERRGGELHRARLWGLVLYAGLALLGLAGATGWPRPALLERLALVFTSCQAVFLLFPGLGSASVPALANATLLALLATLRGGDLAGLAVVAWTLGTGFFLLFDHFARRLWQVRSVPEGLFGLALRDGLRLVVPVALALALFFSVAPPRPHLGLRDVGLAAPLSREELAAAYAQLALAGLVGASAVYYASRLLRRRRPRRPPAVEEVEAERIAEEALPEPARRARPVYAGPRGTIVRAYVRALAGARAAGFRLRPAQTPREIEAALRDPASPLARLTELFMDARYGPAEPRDQQAAEAEAAARAVQDYWHMGRRAFRAAGQLATLDRSISDVHDRHRR